LAAQLDALSPLSILSRGYAVARKLPDGVVVRRAAELEAGDKVALTLGEGKAITVVESTEE
jgi:exodeoxyribonuclease VII large subunit